VSDFSDDWLALREPADAAARADDLVATLGRLPPGPGDVLEVLDLGCGSGANLRHLAPLLGGAGHAQQRWTCVDHDPALLARLPGRIRAWAEARDLDCAPGGSGLRVRADHWRADLAWSRVDLAAEPERLRLPRGGLVTASALLDLVSRRWLDTLLRRCRAGGCALLLVLSYDGRCSLAPAHPDDAAVIALVNRHQRTDKGFGPALGPDAGATAAHRCGVLGYRVRAAPSDWHIGPDRVGLQRALLTGWREAAGELAPDAAAADAWLDDWLAARLAQVDAGVSELLVGHLDLLALP
jgi:SAM-dependent methyltransferase